MRAAELHFNDAFLKKSQFLFCMTLLHGAPNKPVHFEAILRK